MSKSIKPRTNKKANNKSLNSTENNKKRKSIRSNEYDDDSMYDSEISDVELLSDHSNTDTDDVDADTSSDNDNTVLNSSLLCCTNNISSSAEFRNAPINDPRTARDISSDTRVVNDALFIVYRNINDSQSSQRIIEAKGVPVYCIKSLTRINPDHIGENNENNGTQQSNEDTTQHVDMAHAFPTKLRLPPQAGQETVPVTTLQVPLNNELKPDTTSTNQHNHVVDTDHDKTYNLQQSQSMNSDESVQSTSTSAPSQLNSNNDAPSTSPSDNQTPTLKFIDRHEPIVCTHVAKRHDILNALQLEKVEFNSREVWMNIEDRQLSTNIQTNTLDTTPQPLYLNMTNQLFLPLNNFANPVLGSGSACHISLDIHSSYQTESIRLLHDLIHNTLVGRTDKRRKVRPASSIGEMLDRLDEYHRVHKQLKSKNETCSKIGLSKGTINSYSAKVKAATDYGIDLGNFRDLTYKDLKRIVRMGGVQPGSTRPATGTTTNNNKNTGTHANTSQSQQSASQSVQVKKQSGTSLSTSQHGVQPVQPQMNPTYQLQAPQHLTPGHPPQQSQYQPLQHPYSATPYYQYTNPYTQQMYPSAVPPGYYQSQQFITQQQLQQQQIQKQQR